MSRGTDQDVLYFSLKFHSKSFASNLRSYPYLMGRLVDMFGEGQEGLHFIMDHTALCGLLVVAGGALKSIVGEVNSTFW